MGIKSIETRDEAAFWGDVATMLSKQGAGGNDAVVFLHGYKTSFEGAAIGAAQLAADLGLRDGAMGFFSWPSRGRFFSYLADAAAIEASEAAITEFLEKVSTGTGAKQVHLVAHSMGNRGLLRAVTRIAQKTVASAAKPFGHIILAAPDVDRSLFTSLHRAYVDVARRTTLYLSDKDIAVRASRFLHQADRVGFAPPVTVLPDIDTVSVSKVDLSMLGHGYHSECRVVLTDIHQMLRNDLTPERRAGLVARTSGDGEYWELAA